MLFSLTQPSVVLTMVSHLPARWLSLNAETEPLGLSLTNRTPRNGSRRLSVLAVVEDRPSSASAHSN